MSRQGISPVAALVNSTRECSIWTFLGIWLLKYLFARSVNDLCDHLWPLVLEMFLNVVDTQLK